MEEHKEENKDCNEESSMLPKAKQNETQEDVIHCCCRINVQTLFNAALTRIVFNIILIIYIALINIPKWHKIPELSNISEWDNTIMKPLLGVIGYIITASGIVVDMFGIFGRVKLLLQYSIIILLFHLIFSILFAIYYNSTIGTIFIILFCLLDIWIIILSYMTLKFRIRSLQNARNWMSHNSSIPIEYQGIFYMDGNPLPGEVFTFEGGEWYEKDKLLILPGTNSNWTFHNDCKGICLIFALVSHGKYHVHFNDDLSYAYVVPTACTFLGCGEHIRLCKCCIFPTFKKIKDNEYSRVNKMCCGCFEKGNYTLRRVIDENGNKLNGFELLDKIDDECIAVI